MSVAFDPFDTATLHTIHTYPLNSFNEDHARLNHQRISPVQNQISCFISWGIIKWNPSVISPLVLFGIRESKPTKPHHLCI